MGIRRGGYTSHEIDQSGFFLQIYRYIISNTSNNIWGSDFWVFLGFLGFLRFLRFFGGSFGVFF